jgi:aspartyl-tRNA(Asn)/glutamyl-tRNA(Gln) amidotransferase subunit B
MFTSGQSAPAIVQAKGLAQVSDEGAITAVINRTLDAHPDNVAAYLGGKEKLIGFFVGQVMREMRGKADPAVVNRLLAAALAARR